jgi:nucleoid-associated protein YgaU
MRKDAKIGFAIGGVLLAVLTVYVLVVPKHNVPKGVTLVTAPPGSVDSAQTPEPSSAVATDNPATADQTAPVKSDAQAKNDGVDWSKLLSGAAEAPPMMSHTPAPSDADATPTPVTPAASTTPVSDPSVSDAPAPTSDTPAPAASPVNLSAAAPVAPSAGLVKLASPTQPPANARTYTIKPGQTLSSIAADVYGNQRFYVAILRANPNINPNRLRAGSKITLPDISDVKPEAAVPAAAKESSSAAANTYKVESGDNLYRISKKLFGSPKQAEAIYELNKEAIGQDKARLRLGMVLKLPAAPTASAR